MIVVTSLLRLVYGCFVVILFFFFFKQKTAYEMRISDWSSDVCSSDLSALARAGRASAGLYSRNGVGEAGGLEGKIQHLGQPAVEIRQPAVAARDRKSVV